MDKLLVIADDFTGALDTGVRFAEEGIPTGVVVHEGDAEIVPSPEEGPRLEKLTEQGWQERFSVSVFDLESRHLKPEQAFLRLQRVVSGMMEKGYTHFYKKTDSTLRGNIGSELAALVHVLSHRGSVQTGEWPGGVSLFFIPAYPKMGRTTVDGRQYVNGIPLDQTEYAQDLFNPVKSSSVSDIIKEQTELPVFSCTIGLDGVVESGGPAETKSIVVVDGQTDEELERTAAWLAQRGLLRITAGCAGFAEFLLPYLDLPRKRVEPHNCNSQVLVICGSVNPVSIEQIDAAAANGMTSITLTPESIFGHGDGDGESGGRLGKRSASDERGCFVAFDGGLVRTVVTALARGEDAIVRTADSDIGPDHYRRYAEKRGFSREEMVERLKERLGRFAATVFEEAAKCDVRPPSLVLTGGDTAITVMSHLGIREVQPLGSIEGGVAVCKPLAGSGFSPDHVVTKAGGFGSRAVIVNIKSYLENHAGR